MQGENVSFYVTRVQCVLKEQQKQTKGKKSGLKHRKRRQWIIAIQQNPHSREGQREDWKDKQMERHEKKKGRPTRGRGYPSPHQMRNRGAAGSER